MKNEKFMVDKAREFISKYKRWILIIIAILLIVIIVFFSIPRQPKEAPAPLPQATVTGQELVQNAPPVPVEATPVQKSESNMLAVAKSFVEIYGTYSNQSNYANIEIVLPLASSRYRAELAATLQNFRASYQPGLSYEGTTTVVLSRNAEKFNDAAGASTVLLKTQKQMSSGAQSNYTIKYQDIRVDLVREGDQWLVDNAKWIQ